MSNNIKFQRRFNKEEKPEAVKLLTPEESNIYFKEEYGKINNLEVTNFLLTHDLNCKKIKCDEIKCLEMERLKRDFKALSSKVSNVQPLEVSGEVKQDLKLNQNNILSLDKGLKFVNELKAVKFKDDEGNDHYGLVKSEVEKISKLAGVNVELVKENNHLSDNLIPLLIKSIQSLSKRLDVLEKGGPSWND
ncbi:hypothetical protein Mvrk_gpp09 [Cafeteriavirus-dependent mavirus]|uniref:Uncharacterized protein n=2 Tax=Cafeteriavirus-dependent mavirus TaxID=1932923 RepID=F1DAT0_9VIRU|nr:hypothetical protein Mvrk_gpp09 [Maverick-related virus strain Spezl]API81726.1 hypothetical protein Mvrk_gpp09 [Cafeteriavirus-dependent mavirus]ADZ16408.1 hypothetical protein [Maverick-related virus strain Spezl]CAI9421281.1 MV09 [Cafeteriavirus-dependent mavirus]CAI9421324.1 MV09 [Cafeteriavirus-dependent mavirus]CAI9421357.1 MV09 [Cafeteriavirus-dependent mavirus]|tara:strand:- start:721 stop:1293 length:573 start_codon:yes stop_codon:yes gene_type:complete